MRAKSLACPTRRLPQSHAGHERRISFQDRCLPLLTPELFPALKRKSGDRASHCLQLKTDVKLNPVIATVIGEGGSGGALYRWPIWCICPVFHLFGISPRDAPRFSGGFHKAPDAARALKLTANDLLKLEMIDGIVDEPKGGAHRYPEMTAKILKQKLLDGLKELKKMSRNKIADKRIEKFLKMGIFSEKPVK